MNNPTPADRLRKASYETSMMVGDVENLRAMISFGFLDDDADIAEFQRELVRSYLRECRHSILDAREAFTAGYVELCRAASSVSPADVHEFVGASFHEAAYRFAIHWLFELAVAWSEAIGLEFSHIHEDMQMPSQHDIKEHKAAFEAWATAMGKVDADGIAARLKMELVQSLLVCDLLPPSNAELEEEVRKCRRYGKAPPCSQCGEQTKVTSTVSRYRYWKCPRCGHSGKQSRNL